MGIGVSFIGRDGKARQATADSPEEALRTLSEMTGIADIRKQRIPGRGKMDLLGNTMGVGKVKINEQDAAGFLSQKVSDTGSVECDPRKGLKLLGDAVPGAAQGKLYGENADGRRGFFPLATFDPANVGSASIGPEFSTSIEPDNNERDLGSEESFSMNFISRIVAKEDETLAYLTTVYVFWRSITFSGFGRALRLGKEHRGVLGMFGNRGGGKGGILRYDPESHQLQMSLDGDTWEMIEGGQAVPLPSSTGGASS